MDGAVRESEASKMIGTRTQILEWLMGLDGSERIKAEIWKPKRTTKQNAYYWTLLTEIAEKMRISKTEAHNRMLRDYGQPELIEGQKLFVFIPDTDESEAVALKSDTFHIKPTTNVKSGVQVNFRAYYHIRGSHTYNTREMTALLNGCIQEAEALGIPTLSPNELERMRQEDEQFEKRRLQKRDPI